MNAVSPIGHDADLMSLTADIVSAHVANNTISTGEIPALISSVFASLAGLGQPAPAEPAKKDPAVPIRSSVKPEYIVCLEDGAKLKMLKRYIRTRFDMSPEDYRAKWGLPRDYPMVAPAYAETRRGLAMKIGLGLSRKSAPEITETPPVEQQTETKKRTPKPKLKVASPTSV